MADIYILIIVHVLQSILMSSNDVAQQSVTHHSKAYFKDF